MIYILYYYYYYYWMADLYWNDFYIENTIQMEPTDFSKYCISFIKRYYNGIGNLKLIDQGCGNGRDSLYFANNGIKVLGIDKCKKIIEDNNERFCDINLNFAVDDFVTTKDEGDIYYSRFTVHSINENDLNIFLKNTSDKMKNGDIFFIETRSILGFPCENNDKLETYYRGTIGGKHYRILYSLEYLKQKLISFGFKILNEREDKGLAKFRGEDPYIIRLTSTKYDENYIDSIKQLLYKIITPYHLASQKHKINIFNQMVHHLDEFGISYWLCYGTLLGYLRYSSIIPWDDDIDICINIKDLHQLQNSINNTKYTLTKANDMLYRFTIEGTEMDIFVIDFSLDNPNEMKFDEVYPLMKGTFCGIECNVPNKYIGFFNRRYGYYDHLGTCLIWNHKVNDYWDRNFINNKFLITKGDCDKIISEIESLIEKNTKRSVDLINNFKIDNGAVDLVLSCAHYSGLDMFLNQLSNILIFNRSVIILYKIKRSLFEEIKSYNVNIPLNVLFNDKFIDENQWDISVQNNKLLLCHIDNYKYIINLKEFNYFGLISQNTYFLKPIDIITSFTFFKIDIDKNEWKNEYIRRDKKINSYKKDLYGGQLDGTIIPKKIFALVFNNITFDQPLEDYPYHEVYIPTFTYDYIKDKPNKYAFCKICWTNEHSTIELSEMQPLYKIELYSAIYLSDHIPYNDPRRIYMDSFKGSNTKSLSNNMMVHIVKKKDGTSKRLLIRNIEGNDYYKEYLDLLKQLTSIDPDKISSNDFNSLVDRLNDDHSIIVIEDIDDNVIIGSSTLLVEYKFIHNMGKVGHIEDVVIDYEYRGCGLGKLLIDALIQLAKKNECYKVILDCSNDNVTFYEKCGFVKKEIEMVKYF